MASYKTLTNGRVRVFVCKHGIRESSTHRNKTQAKNWAIQREVALAKLENIVDDSRTVGDLFERYSDKVSPTKEGGHWELVRFNMFMKTFEELCATRLIKIKREDLEDWVDLRLKTVKPSTVNRELNLISHALTKARKWRWMSHNPMAGLERPKDPPARIRRISKNEIKIICHVLGYSEDVELTFKREFVGVAFLFAIETAMRAGEICSLTPSSIDIESRVAHLTKTKNGSQRKVPLSDRAIELLGRLPKPASKDIPVFHLTSRSLSSIFRTHRLKTNIKDLTFHDTRHEATTRLADKLHVLELASVTGHRNINELLTYYNKSASEIALKLN